MHINTLRVDGITGSIGAMDGRGSRPMTGPDRERLSPCVCSTLRMVSRAVTQLYDDILRPSGLRVTQFSMLAAIARLGEANLRREGPGAAGGVGVGPAPGRRATRGRYGHGGDERPSSLSKTVRGRLRQVR